MTEALHADDVEVDPAAVVGLALRAPVLAVVLFALAPGVEGEVLLTHCDGIFLWSDRLL